MRRELLGLLVEILSEELMQLVVVVTRGHVEPIVPIRSIVSSVNGAAFIMMMARIYFLSHRFRPTFHLVLYHFWLWWLSWSLILSLIVNLLRLFGVILLRSRLLYGRSSS